MSHVPIDVDAINWDQFLNLQEGGQRTNTDYFVGERYMRGYGVLGSIGKFLLPIAICEMPAFVKIINAKTKYLILIKQIYKYKINKIK